MGLVLCTLRKQFTLCAAHAQVSNRPGGEGILDINDLHNLQGDTYPSCITLSWYMFPSRKSQQSVAYSTVQHIAHAGLMSDHSLSEKFASIPVLALNCVSSTLSPLSSYSLSPQYLAHYAHLTSTRSNLDQASIDAFQSIYLYDFVCHALVYKPVAKKVCTVPTTMPAEYRVVRQLPADTLASMPELPTHPPNPIPGAHFMHEHADKLDLDPVKCL
jgi:hypothetical protein